MKHRTASIVMLIAASTAAAQTARTGSVPRGFTPNEPPAAPTRTTQAVMQSNGGSLMQASDDSASVASAYTLYGVPEPQAKVLKKHDLVNIVVQEVSQYASTGTADLQRAADFDAKVDQFIALNLKSLSLHGTGQATNPVEAKFEASRDFKGTGNVDRSDTFTIRLEAEVIDVKPNGTMVIQARKHIKTDEEDTNVILTGTCRVQDVDTTNSVLSTDLHDLDLVKQTKGAVRDATKRGLIHRLLDFVNPF